MESFLSRYRNLTVLLIVIAAQLLLLAYQVKTNQDVRLIRVWAVSVVTPVERFLELIRANTFGVVENYFVLLNAREENRKLKDEIGRVKMEDHFLKTELGTADRARALSAFQQQTPSKTIAARIIGNGVGATSAMVFVDRGSTSGVESGMAVVTPDGIVGKVIEAYPMSSSVLLVSDPTFAAGVVSQKNRVRGTLKGQGHGTCIVDYVQNEEKVDLGEWFYTSGYDRVFPKGFPVGQAKAVRNGPALKEIFISPSGLQGGLEEVLVVLEGVHQAVPQNAPPTQRAPLLAPPPDAATGAGGTALPGSTGTDIDRMREEYKAIGEAQHHVFGEGTPGSTPPDFNKRPPAVVMPGPVVGTAPPTSAGTTPNVGTAPKIAPGPGPGQAGWQRPTGSPTGAASGTVAKPNAAAAGQAPAPAAPVKAKPKPKAPALVTDPTDADPGSESETKPPRNRAGVWGPLPAVHGSVNGAGGAVSCWAISRAGAGLA